MAKKKIRERFTVCVESLDQEGRGVAHRDGKAVFIEGALPGEEVVYERYRSKPTFELGYVVEVLEASKDRVEPRCPYFGFQDGCCGGCAMQHYEDHAQILAKQKVLTDAFERIGKVAPAQLLPPLMGPLWHYRCRARMAVRDVAKKGEVLVGFHEKRSSFIADMRSCQILPQKVSDLLVELRALIGSLSVRKKVAQIELAVAPDSTALVFRFLEAPSSEDLVLLHAFEAKHDVQIWSQPAGPDSVFPLEQASADRLRLEHPDYNVSIVYKPTDFTQVNQELNQMMVKRALGLLEANSGESAVDFFCGLGNFTLPIARGARRVVGIEGSQAMVERAALAAKENGLDQVASFVARNLFTWTEADWDDIWQRLSGVDKVLIDPPREGAAAVCEAFAKTQKRPQRLVYVSCNPATLARDSGILVNSGQWRLLAAGVMNMFPQTSHVESIAVFAPDEQASAEIKIV